MPAAARVVGTRDSDRVDQPLRQLALGDVRRRMARDHVPDFVAQDPGELRLVLQPVEQSARDEDRSAGEGEGIDGLGIP